MELERRDFLKGAALGAFGIASVGALGACAPSARTQTPHRPQRQTEPQTGAKATRPSGAHRPAR